MSKMKIMETIIKELKTSPKSRYQISKETGISEAILCKMLYRTRACRAETAEILLTYFGYDLTKRKRGKK